MTSSPPVAPKRLERVLERVLERLGFAAPPEPDAAGLAAVYDAWCRRVGSDNVQKRIHLASGAPGPLPGDAPDAFFGDWLAGGAAGTCWSANGALHALLETLGFRSRRVLATMLVAPDLPPNHGSVCVDLESKGAWLVDGSMLHGEPLRLPEEGEETTVAHGAWGLRCGWRDGRRVVRWRPNHVEAGLDCRLDAFGAGAADFASLHEATRAWSPFNFSLFARRNVGECVVGAAFGHRVEIDADGRFRRTPLGAEGRLRLLVDELGVDEGLARRLPADEDLPPPPGSRTAARAAASRPGGGGAGRTRAMG